MKVPRFAIKKEQIFSLALLIFVVLLRFPVIIQPISSDIGAISYNARLILDNEPLYGTHHPAHHLPAVYYTYALIFSLLGDRPEALQVFLIPWIWLSALLLWRVGKQISSSVSGMLAALFFVLIGSMTNLNGDTAEIELFANLPIIAVIWLSGRLLEKQRRPITYTLIGVLCALCFLYKAVYLAPLLAIGMTLLLDAILQYNSKAWRKLFQRGLAILIGFGLILGAVTAYFASLGLITRLWLVFQLGTGYVELQNNLPDIYIFIIPAVLIIVANLVFFLLGILGVGRTIVVLPKTFSQSRATGLTQFMAIIWLAASFLEVGISKLGYAHYGLLLIPPFALIVGAEIGGLWERIKPQVGLTGLLKQTFLPALLVLAVIGNTVFISMNYIGGYIAFLSGQISRNEFILNDTFMGVDNLQAEMIAQYIERHSTPNDFIFTWTELAQIPYLAHRRSSVDVLWPIYIARLGPPERVFTLEPVYVVVGPLFEKDKQYPDWLVEGLKYNYQLETNFEEYKIYRRITN